MVTAAENELMTSVEGDAPLGRLMREHDWIPFALSENLTAGHPPTPCGRSATIMSRFVWPTAGSASSTSTARTAERHSFLPVAKAMRFAASTTDGRSTSRPR